MKTNICTKGYRYIKELSILDNLLATDLKKIKRDQV